MMVIGRELKVEFEAISRYLAPRRFIERRTAVGAPSPDAVRTFVAHRRAGLVMSATSARINGAISNYGLGPSDGCSRRSELVRKGV